jgi:hypothetical protein
MMKLPTKKPCQDVLMPSRMRLFRITSIKMGRTLLILLAGAALSGCVAIDRALGTKVDLNDKQVDSHTLAVPNNGPLCPGYEIPLIATATLAGGEKLQTEGAGGGKVLWSSFTAEARGARITPEGILSVDVDPRETLGSPVHVTLRVGLRGPVAELDVPLRYDCAYVANFNGQPGADGDSGADGAEGVPGANGNRGSDGADGQQVQVLVSMVLGPTPGSSLLSVLVQGSRAQRLYYVDPARGSLLVRANGGNGGDGGAGGYGFGGSGRPGSNNGSRGDGGNGGNGGSLFLRVSPEAKAYLKCIHFENRGGRGGRGSTPGANGRPGPQPMM